ncbi:MAG: hypothetical protein H0V17_20065 [Deltaproteobacteria bacterium]|nr:hypothetical protein [Deltaproteobacteria bacterium]
MNRINVCALILLATGCSSLVDDPCSEGYHLQEGRCVEAVVPQPPSQPPSPPVLCIFQESDPMNCGECNHVCASGICDVSQCVGENSGHVVLIGHDYARYNPAMAQVLGNAITLANRHDVGIARLADSTTPNSANGTGAAITTVMTDLGRPWHEALLPAPGEPLTGVDVLIVFARVGNPDTALAAGAAWSRSIDELLDRAGVVIVLEGAGGVGYRFAEGATMFNVGPPLDVTRELTMVNDAQDAVVQHVVSPYLADSTSVAFPGQTGVIGVPAGAVVVHLTR